MPLATIMNFDLWKNYTRRQIAKSLGYRGEAAIWRGVVTPRNTKQIYLFVTREKQKSLTQYNDSIYDNVLLWEGERKHKADQRIVNAQTAGEEIYLFFRTKHHQEFIYFGRVRLLSYELKTKVPSQFALEIEALSPYSEDRTDAETSPVVSDANIDTTERTTLRIERVGHDKWRRKLLQLWDQSCSVTELQKERLLRASHIKPWRHSSDQDRLHQHNGLILNPSLDCLFDCGFITFLHLRGCIKISNILSEQDRKILNVHETMSLRKAFPENKEYLEYHNDCVFEKWIKANMSVNELRRTLQL